MIGTHNSLTCYPSKYIWYKPFSFLWKCQRRTLFEQLDEGVSYFDIRVRIDYRGNLKFCHGLVDLNVPFSLDYILNLFEKNHVKCRIILEHNKRIDLLMLFIPHRYLGKTIEEVIIKKEWKIIYSNKVLIPIIDYSYIPFHSDKNFIQNLKHFNFSTIKKWAKKYNPVITSEMVKSEDKIYFMDYYK